MPNYAQKFFVKSVAGLVAFLQRIAGLPDMLRVPCGVGGSGVVVCESNITHTLSNEPSESDSDEDTPRINRADLELRLATLKQIFHELKLRGKNFVYAAHSEKHDRFSVFLGVEDLVDAVCLAGEIVDTVLNVLLNQDIDDEFTEGLSDIVERFEMLFDPPEESEEIPIE